MLFRALLLALGGALLIACQPAPDTSQGVEPEPVPADEPTAVLEPVLEARPDPPPLELVATQPLTDDLPTQSIEGGQSLQFTLDLSEGDVWVVEVEQLDVDVSLAVLEPGGDRRLEIDHPSGPVGFEDLAWNVEVDGTHTLVVDCPEPQEPGNISLRSTVTRGNAADRRLAEGLRLYLDPSARPADDLDDADTYRDLLAKLATHGGEPPSHPRVQRWLEARSLRRLGQRTFDGAQLLEAGDAFERALALLRPDGSGWEVAALLNDCGMAHRLVGSPLRALERLEEALELSESLGHTSAAATALNNLGVLHEALGEPEEALAYYGRALELWGELGQVTKAATTHHNIGVTFLSLGLLDEADAALQHALEIRSRLQDLSGQATTLTVVGWARALEGDHECALDAYDRALHFHRDLGNSRGEVATLDRRALVLAHLGQTRAAVDDLQTALDLLRDSGNRVAEAHVQANVGTLYFELGEGELAARSLARAQELFQSIGDLQGEALVLATLGGAERSQNRLAAAITYYEEALAKVESVRDQMSSPTFRRSFLAARFDLVDALVELRMALNDIEPGVGHGRTAFEIAERARARGLLEGLSRGAGWWQEAASELVERERQLRRQIRFKEDLRLERIENDGPANDIERLGDEVASLLIEYQRLEGRLWRSAETGFTPRALGVEAIRDSLDPDTVLVVIYPGSEQSTAWIVDATGFQSVELPIPDTVDLQHLARQTRDHLAASHRPGHRGQAESDARQLSNLVLLPLAEALRPWRDRRLVLVADGALAVVPFATLPSPLASDEQAGRAPPLVEHFEIVHLPSVSVLPILRRESPVPAGKLALIADPVFTADDPRLDPSPQIAQGAIEGLSDHSTVAPWAGGSRGDIEKLRRLPWAGREAEAILALLDETDPRWVALGLAAHRDAVTRGPLDSYALLHFATHGWLDDRHPLLSGIVLSRFDSNGRRREAFLRVPEIARLHLAAELVVLSACDTGRGESLRGEGVVGMAHAFFQAGARRLVVSHWSVDDEATALLMEHFYRGLLVEQLAPGAALRKAQRALKSEARWSAPYYWGAFTLQGDWRPIAQAVSAAPSSSSR